MPVKLNLKHLISTYLSTKVERQKFTKSKYLGAKIAKCRDTKWLNYCIDGETIYQRLLRYSSVDSIDRAQWTLDEFGIVQTGNLTLDRVVTALSAFSFWRKWKLCGATGCAHKAGNGKGNNISFFFKQDLLIWLHAAVFRIETDDVQCYLFWPKFGLHVKVVERNISQNK